MQALTDLNLDSTVVSIKKVSGDTFFDLPERDAGRLVADGKWAPVDMCLGRGRTRWAP